jgi:hypothetical protein
MAESLHHETKKTAPVVKTVRDRLVDFHDRHLQVSPVAADAAKAFESIVPVISSKKGKAVVEKIRPHVASWSKNIEMGTAAVDVTLGLVGAGVAAEGLIGGILEKRAVEKGASALDTDVQETALGMMKTDMRPRIKRGLAGIGLGGVFWGLRPVTRIADAAYRYGAPLARRVVGAVDGILLRREQKQEVKRVFVGQGKA